MAKQEIAQIAHLLRRAGFGATRDELEAYEAKGYEATVDELLDPRDPEMMPDDLMRRYHTDTSAIMGPYGSPLDWLYRMITTTAPLEEKIALFWHGIFATGIAKISHGMPMVNQVEMFRRRGMGRLPVLLTELSRDPAMLYYLDNTENHKGAINENYGREILELFSMGVGSYTEQDIKECSRSFTGWTIGNLDYMHAMAHKDSIGPYGRFAWFFEYRPEDHDDGEKKFLGRRGNFNGEDVIEIICQQPATAHFISRHMYSFFVADEAPVPQWPYMPPIDPDAIELLSKTYLESGYDLRAMLRVLFNSDFFKEARYQKVKSPAEMVVGVLRLTGEFSEEPRWEMAEVTRQIVYMGQQLMNPPSVEGWHQGTEWTNSGTLVERVNFASDHLGDVSSPGVRAIIDRLAAEDGGVLSPERLVDGCLEQLGAFSVPDDTRSALLATASKAGEVRLGGSERGEEAEQRVAQMLRLIAAAPEFQLA